MSLRSTSRRSRILTANWPVLLLASVVGIMITQPAAAAGRERGVADRDARPPRRGAPAADTRRQPARGGATVIYVSAAAGGAGDGSSWKDAYTDLQTGLAAATGGDQVWVAAGTYTPTIDEPDASDTFEVRDRVRLYGGFDGTEATLEQRAGLFDQTVLSGLLGEEIQAAHVVESTQDHARPLLDGFTISGGTAAGVYVRGGVLELSDSIFEANRAGVVAAEAKLTARSCTFNDNTEVGIYFWGTEQDTLILEDCEFVGGHYGGVEATEGAVRIDGCTFRGCWKYGLYIGAEEPVDVEISNSTFAFNVESGLVGHVTYLVDSTFEGNGDSAFQGSAELISNCTFRANTASTGGALSGHFTVIRDSVFEGNVADAGGAMLLAGETLIEGCSIVGNTAGFLGGGILPRLYTDDAAVTVVVRSSLIADNRVTDTRVGRGGGIYLTTGWDLSLDIINSTIVNNVATTGSGSSFAGGGIWFYSQGGLHIHNSIIRGNTRDQVASPFSDDIEVSYSNVEFQAVGVGNINRDARFLDPDGPDDDPHTWQDNDYRLAVDSPCIASGDPASDIAKEATDIEGDPRLLHCRIDIGADEFAPLRDCNKNTIADGCDVTEAVSPDCANNGVPDECEPDCNGNDVVDSCDILASSSVSALADGLPFAQDLAASPGGDYPSGTFTAAPGEAAVYHIGPQGGVQRFAEGTPMHPSGLAVVPDEFGGSGPRLFMASTGDGPVEQRVSWIGADGVIHPFSTAGSAGNRGLVYIPESLKNPVAGQLLVTSASDSADVGSIHAVDESGQPTPLLTDVGVALFTPALSPGEFGDWDRQVFIGAARGPGVHVFDLHSNNLAPFTTLPASPRMLFIRQLVFSPAGWAAALAPGTGDGAVLLVSVTYVEPGSGPLEWASLGQGEVFMIDEDGHLIAGLQRDPDGRPIDPRGLVFDGDELLVNNTADGTVLRAGLEHFELLDCNHNGVPDHCDLADAASLDCNDNGVPDECEMPRTAFSEPPDSAIDARQPHPIDDPASPFGWDIVEIDFAGLVPPLGVEDLELVQEGSDAPPPTILAIDHVSGNVLSIELSGPINPGAWTTLHHPCSGWSVRLGYLPGDVDGDGSTGPLDILALIDHFNDVVERPFHAVDIDRNQLRDPQDVLRLIDLLHGVGSFEVWNGRSLP